MNSLFFWVSPDPDRTTHNMSLLPNAFPEMPLISTIGLAHFPARTLEGAPGILDLAQSVCGGDDGALVSKKFHRSQCMCGSFNCFLHGFGHASVRDSEECSAHAMFQEILPCIARLIPKKIIVKCAFYLFVSFLHSRDVRPRSPFMRLLLDAHRCENKNIARIMLQYVLAEEIDKLRGPLPTEIEAMATLLQYFSESDIHHTITLSHREARIIATGSSVRDPGHSE